MTLDLDVTFIKTKLYKIEVQYIEACGRKVRKTNILSFKRGITPTNVDGNN